MKRTIVSIALVAASITGCGGTDASVSSEPQAGSNRPTETAAPATEEPSPEPTEQESEVAKFGETFTFEDGIEVTVSAPAPFKPSETAAFEKAPAYIAFDVTVVNGSKANFDPNGMSLTMQSSNVEADQIFDSGQNVGGTPTTPVLPGRETKFKSAWAVQSATDLVLQVTPGFEYNGAIFTT